MTMKEVMALIVCVTAIIDSIIICVKTQKNEKRNKVLIESIHTATASILSIAWFILSTFYEKNSLQGIVSVCLATLYFLSAGTRGLNAVGYYRELPQNKLVRKAMKKFKHLKQTSEENFTFELNGVRDVIKHLEELFASCKNATNLTQSSIRIWNFLLADYIRIYEKYLHTKKEKERTNTSNLENMQTMSECSRRFIAYIEQACEEQAELNREESFVQTLDFQADAEIFYTSIDAEDFSNHQLMYLEETENKKEADGSNLQQRQM